MRHRVLAVEHPVIRVRSFNPNAGLMAGDNLGGAKNCLHSLRLDLEPGVGADEHVHQCALAHAQTKSIAEQAT